MKKDIEFETPTTLLTEDPLKAFTYKHINDAAKHDQAIYCGDFFSAKNHDEGSHDYIDFMYIGDDNPNAELSDLESIYITIDDRDDKNIKKAWNAILPALIEHQVYGARVVREGSGYAHNITLPKCSQQIVLRRFVDHDRSATRWNRILSDITRNLIAAKVTPGPINESGGYEVLGSFCLRRKTPVAMSMLSSSVIRLEDLAIIGVPDQPPQNLVSMQEFDTAVRKLDHGRVKPKNSRPKDFRKQLFLAKLRRTTGTQTEEDLLESAKDRDKDNEDDETSSGFSESAGI